IEMETGEIIEGERPQEPAVAPTNQVDAALDAGPVANDSHREPEPPETDDPQSTLEMTDNEKWWLGRYELGEALGYTKEKIKAGIDRWASGLMLAGKEHLAKPKDMQTQSECNKEHRGWFGE